MKVIYIGRSLLPVKGADPIKPFNLTEISRGDFSRLSNNRHLLTRQEYLKKVATLHRAPLQQMARNAGVDHRGSKSQIQDALRTLAKEHPSREEVLEMTSDELSETLGEYDQTIRGRKAEKVERLLSYLGYELVDDPDDEDDDVEAESADEPDDDVEAGDE